MIHRPNAQHIAVVVVFEVTPDLALRPLEDIQQWALSTVSINALAQPLVRLISANPASPSATPSV